MEICVCKYPLIVIDERDGDKKPFISIPLSIVDRDMPIPDMEVVEEVDSDNKTKMYMKVQWQKPPKDPKKYFDIGGDHIVLAGCPKEALQCDAKSIYVVYHPIDEWESYHMIELKENKNISGK
jgi:hypothetical protein